jgi:hypothetical protein
VRRRNPSCKSLTRARGLTPEFGFGPLGFIRGRRDHAPLTFVEEVAAKFEADDTRDGAA